MGMRWNWKCGMRWIIEKSSNQNQDRIGKCEKMDLNFELSFKKENKHIEEEKLDEKLEWKIDQRLIKEWKLIKKLEN